MQQAEAIQPEQLTPEQVEAAEENLYCDFETYCEELLQIRPKEGGKLIPLRLNTVQRHIRRIKVEALAAGRKRRFLILKARRFGATTYEQADTFHKISTIPHYQALTLAHDALTTRNIFRISTTFYNNIPVDMRPSRQYSSTRDLNFEDLNSLHYIGTAGSHDVGRGDTLQKAHGSEVAFWTEPKDVTEAAQVPNLIAGILEAASEGEVSLESTANGMANWFYRECMKAIERDSAFTIIFLPWFIDDTYQLPLDSGEQIEYTTEEQRLADKHRLIPEQIKWRRSKKEELRDKFLQEYPEDEITCFLMSGLRFFLEEDVGKNMTGLQDSIRTERDGQMIVWEEPVLGRRYVAGADVAEGLPEGARSVCKILEWESGREVAVLRGRWRPEVFADLAATLCTFYNSALLGVEANNHGHSMLNTLENTLYYSNLYYRPTPAGTQGKIGWDTNGQTRPVLLDDLESAMRKQELHVNDRTLLAECRTFVLNPNGKYEAGPGNFDDTIFATGIAWQMRKIGGGIVISASGERPSGRQGEQSYGATRHL